MIKIKSHEEEVTFIIYKNYNNKVIFIKLVGEDNGSE